MFTRTLSRWLMSFALAALALVTVTGLVTTSPVQGRSAATLINCSGSIQACIDAANDGDTILIAAGRYTESLTLSKAVSLTGENRDTTILHAMAGQRVLTVTGATISNSVVISGLTFTGGSADFGGGILIGNLARPLLYNISVSNNFAGLDGGGLYSNGPLAGSLAVSNSSFISNTAGIGGGGLWVDGAASLMDTTFIGNAALGSYGGGAAIWGEADVKATTFATNTAAMYGGGAMFDRPTRLEHSVFSDNSADLEGGGAWFHHGTNMTDTLFIRNTAPYCGGVSLEDVNSVISATFAYNAAQSGGGICFWNYMPASGDLANTLLVGNSAASGQGTALYVFGSTQPSTITLRHVTIASPTIDSGVAVVVSNAPVNLINTLIASHAIGISNTGGIVYEDYNLFFNVITNTIGVTSGGHSLVGDPGFVDPLHGNYHLQFNSAAIDHGVDAGIYTDLDGNVRPHGAGFDIGAYEFSGGPRYVATTGDDTSNDCTNSSLPCATLQHAIDVANNGEQVLIASGLYTQSATLDKPVSVTGVNSATTILHAMAGQRVLTVTGATIGTSVVISGLTFTGGSANYGGGMLITDAAQPTLQAVQFISNTASSTGGGLHTTSALTLTGAKFLSNTAGGGGGLYTLGSLLTLHDTDFIANVGGGVSADFTAAQVVGGQFVSNSGTALRVDGPVEISATRFISNSGGNPAGGVEAYNSATILNAHFENNTGEDTGGLFFNNSLSDNEALVLSNTVFINNTGEASGGVYAYYGSFAVINSTFERNRATTSIYGGSGALYAAGRMRMSGSKVLSNTSSTGVGGVGIWGYAHVSDSLFENNVAGDGGAVYVQGSIYLTNTQVISNAAIGELRMGGGVVAAGSAYLNGGRFERNSAQGYGGGLYAFELVMSGTIFVSNTARYGGGGASIDLSPIEITGGRFEGNRTLESFGGGGHGGGGLLAQYGSQLSISGTQFINNVTADKGGGLHTQGPSHLDNVLFAGNSADTDAAAIYFGQSTETQRDLLHVTIADTISNPKSAISILSGTLNLTNTIIANHAIGISNTGGIVYEDYNLFFNAITNTVGMITSGGHSLVGDPRFVDPLNGDYHLQFGSAAIDHGVDAGIYTDLDGNPRPVGSGFDIGAYEFQGNHYLWLPLIRK